MAHLTEHERITQLKGLKTLANAYLEEYKARHQEGGKSWVSLKSERAMEQLTDIIGRINRDLHPEKVKQFCKPLPDRPFKWYKADDPEYAEVRREQQQFNEAIFSQVIVPFMQIDLARLSPLQFLHYDISWLQEGTAGMYVDFVLGNKEVTGMAEFLPGMISDVRTIAIPFYTEAAGLDSHAHLIEQAITLSDRQEYLSSNLLLIPVIESIVRKLCLHVARQQNPGVPEEELQYRIYEKHTSLENLITKGGWKNDYPMRITEILVNYADINEPAVNAIRKKAAAHLAAKMAFENAIKRISEILEPTCGHPSATEQKEIQDLIEKTDPLRSDLITDEKGEANINLCTLLNFLIRKYKDDRNSIVHGDFDVLNHKWKNYISFTALNEVTKVCQNYLKIYPLPDLDTAGEINVTIPSHRANNGVM